MSTTFSPEWIMVKGIGWPEQTVNLHWHGTRSGYTNHKCHCARCRRANTAWTRNRRAKAAGRA